MNLRQEVRRAAEGGELDALERLIEHDPRALRHVLALTYHSDGDLRAIAAHGMAIGGRHHPRLTQRLVRRLVWAMNDESGTNSLTAPAVVLAIARERPDLLVSVSPDLVRLATDEDLRPDLQRALRVVVDRCQKRLGSALINAIEAVLRRGAHGDA